VNPEYRNHPPYRILCNDGVGVGLACGLIHPQAFGTITTQKRIIQ